MASLHLATLELREVRIPFRFAFEHSLARRKEARSLLVALHARTGEVGWGEIVPRAYLTGETLEGAWQDVVRWWEDLRRLALPRDRAPFEALRPLYLQADGARRTAAWCGVDLAVTDLWARMAGVPVASLLGPASTVPLTAPVGLGAPAAAGLLALGFRLLGYRHYKVKVGDAADLRRVAAVRMAAGAGADLRVDANGAWQPEEAVERARELRRPGVSCVEQPVADLEGLARVQAELPVMADESLCTLEDARRLGSSVGLWNVRLAKVGGFSGLQEMARLAHQGGVALHLGVLVGETSLLAAAQRACLGLGPFAYVEYGFPEVLLSCDPFRGGPGGVLGRGRPPSARPGLGVAPIPSRLDRVTVRREVLS